MNGNERQEARHEYNLFLDREIQKRLLSVEDDEEEEAGYQRLANGDGLTSTCPAPTSNWIRAKPSSLRNWKNSESFDAWCPESTKRIRKADKQQQRSVNREREAPKWELISGKDSKSKDINVSFKHYADWRKYMEQYRKEHTYNSGSSEARDVDLGKLAISGALDRAKQQQQQSRSPPNSAKAATTRTLSDPNILDLASKCRLNATGARSHSGDLSKRERDATPSRPPADNKPESAPDPPPPPPPSKCCPAARSQHSFSMTSKIGNKSLAPLGGPQAGKMSSLTASSASAMKITPIGTTPKRLDLIAQPVSMAGSKRSRHTTTNGFLLDTNSSSRSINNKSPPLLLPNSQLKTVDLLCHVSTIHKQLWFDASGRAYVSLATRYDPVHK